MAKLTADEAGRQLGRLKGWAQEGDAIRKEYAFGSFREAVSFVVRLASSSRMALVMPDQ